MSAGMVKSLNRTFLASASYRFIMNIAPMTAYSINFVKGNIIIENVDQSHRFKASYQKCMLG